MHTSIDTGASGPEILFLRGTSSDTLGIPGMRAILPHTFTTVSTILFEERSIPGRCWDHTENYGTMELRNYGKAFIWDDTDGAQMNAETAQRRLIIC